MIAPVSAPVGVILRRYAQFAIDSSVSRRVSPMASDPPQSSAAGTASSAIEDPTP